jgi:hypothetical protein
MNAQLPIGVVKRHSLESQHNAKPSESRYLNR